MSTDTIGSFIVPEEFATLLGLVFSTIPQVKKGTDSRIGFGYRFGNHADTQVILELGPQVSDASLVAVVVLCNNIRSPPLICRKIRRSWEAVRMTHRTVSTVNEK